jgi:Mrp family chromosome partitioning ATPase
MMESTAITALFDGVAARVHASVTPMRTLAVTSTLRAEGTTTVALGMALSLAAYDSTTAVLLIDANWLHPSLTKQAGRSDAIGLAEVLRDGISLDRAVVRTARRGLSFLPAGQAGTESPPLGRLASVLEEAHQAFARVVIDLSPVMIAPSLVVPWANSVDQTYLVLRRAATPVALIRRAMAEVGAERAPQLILNRTRDRAGDWGPFRVG